MPESFSIHSGDDVELASRPSRLAISQVSHITVLLALSFLSFWHIGIQAEFLTLFWWQFLNPALLGVSYFGTFSLSVPTCILPLTIESKPFLRFIFRQWWLVCGILPAVLFIIASFSFVPASARLLLLALCVACGCAGTVICLGLPSDHLLSRLWPWAVSLGTLILQSVKCGFSSVNPVADNGFIITKVLGCFVAAACTLYLHRVFGALEFKHPQYSYVSLTSCSLLLATIPVLACAVAFNIAFFSNPGMLPKFVGHQPFPAGTMVLLCFLLSIPGAFVFQRLLPKRTGVLTAAGVLTLGTLALIGETFCTGQQHCFSNGRLVGGAILAAAMPLLWWVVAESLQNAAHVGKCGRVFSLAGLLIFFLVPLYVSAVTFQPLAFLGGQLGVWFWMVLTPCLIGLLVIAKVIPSAGDRQPEDLMSFKATGTALGVTSAAVALVAILPACIYRIVVLSSMSDQQSDTLQFSAMSFNVQGGYDTNGGWNGQCMVDIIREHRPDHVALPEGEGMRFYTGNRDHVEWTATSLGMFVDYGPPSFTGGAGVAALSLRQPLRTKWTLMPKNKGDMNRFLLVSEYKLGSETLSVFSAHTEWFGDPSIQTAFIAHLAKAAVKTGPVIVLGDFNVEPNGANNNALNASSLKVLVDDGTLKSATPLDCHEDKPLGHLCKSPFDTAMIDEVCNPCVGYQLDYIFYSPRWLQLVDGSVHSIDGSLPGGGWCSDHQPLIATFKPAS